MRRFLLLTTMCVLALFGTLNAQETITVGTKTGTDASIPVWVSYKYNYSQQIYTASEINHASGLISEIAFFVNGTASDREVCVYMINTNKENFSSKEDWVYVSNSDIVYEGKITTTARMSIALTKNFEYTGGNILLCVQDVTGIYKDFSPTYDVMATVDNKAIYFNTDEAMVTPENISTRTEDCKVAARRNIIQFVFEANETIVGAPATPSGLTAKALGQKEIQLSWNRVDDAVSYNVYNEDDEVLANVFDTTFVVEYLEAETEYCYRVSALNDSLESHPSSKACATTLRNPDVVATPETLTLGEIVLGEFWSENNDKSLEVSLECIETEITNITVSDGFFVLPDAIDYAANPVTFTITYNEEALSVGEKNATLEVTCAHGVESIPVTAVVYTPTTPDVFELAQEITFEGSTFSDTPEFDELHDNYNLPEEANAGNTPDAVYAFELDKELSVTVDVTGTNGIYAIYKAEEFEGNGPKADNNYEGEKGAPSTFFYDFSDGSLDYFTLADKDGDGNNWRILSTGINGKTLASDSWLSPSALTPDNYLVTKEKYEIKATSKLSFDYCSAHNENFGVEISSDGINFTSIWSKSGKNYPTASAEIPLADYAGQTVYIALRHYDCTDGMNIMIDNFQLTNNDGDFTTYPAGKYYLVAAAESAFTVNAFVGANPADLPAAPQNLKADAVTSTTVTLSWDAVDGAVSYNIYNGQTLVADNITATTYVVEGLQAYTEYTFTVRSFDGEYTSFSSAELHVKTDDIAITAPANVEVTAVDPYSLKITWDAVEGATSYNIYWGDVVIKEGLTETFFVVEDLLPKMQYFYVVSALRRDVEVKSEGTWGETAAIDFNAADLAKEFMFDFNEQSFEGLRTIDADNDGNNWMLSNEDQGFDATYAIKSYSYYYKTLTPDNYLVTKVPYMIDAFSVVTLNAKISAPMDIYKGEHYAVVVSENGSDWTVVFEETLDTLDWVNASVSLEAYAGKSLLIGVRHYNCTDLSYILVDNFALNTVVTKPAAPTNLTLEATSSSSITLKWDAVEGATSYKVYRGMIFLADVTENTYVATGLNAETNYCFSVSAVNEAGESERSEEKCMETLPVETTVPAAPVATAEATSDSTIVLTWNAVEGATNYNVYSADTLVVNVTDTTYTVAGLAAGTEYKFTVTAVNAAGESEKSAEVSATTTKTGIAELTSSINIYPNPVNDKLYIEAEVEIENVVVYDMFGRQQSTVNGQQSLSIDVAGLNSGVYFVKVVTSEGDIVKRFIKK